MFHWIKSFLGWEHALGFPQPHVLSHMANFGATISTMIFTKCSAEKQRNNKTSKHRLEHKQNSRHITELNAGNLSEIYAMIVAF